jgi:putative ABC transport system substrate-binding protein
LSISAGPEIGGKRLELVHDLTPRAVRVALLRNPLDATNRLYLQVIRDAAGPLGLTLLMHETRGPADLAVAFNAIAEQKTGRSDPRYRSAHGLASEEHRRVRCSPSLPAVYGVRDFADDGGLMSYGASIFDIWRRVAGYLDKILKGAIPADLPIEQPTRFELVVNLKNRTNPWPDDPAFDPRSRR